MTPIFFIFFWKLLYRTGIPGALDGMFTALDALVFALWPPDHARHLRPIVRFLIQVDADFRRHQADVEVLRRREALARGGNDSVNVRGYPCLQSVLKEWGDHLNRRNTKLEIRLRRQGYF